VQRGSTSGAARATSRGSPSWTCSTAVCAPAPSATSSSSSA
jgi:hypothetical protein